MLTAAILAITMSLSTPQVECVRGGCGGGHLCMEKSEAENAVSTCEWNDSYGCYPKFGVCKVQADGKCGWTEDPQLTQCVEANK